ncbi:alpha/beta hydrolase family protein [Nocardia sp. NBC_01329]|uniref:alpha/beta hydrolase family protein n=1 Tax=Nocardia sp. NBC_01329 TaxID=2903594 RepID=UPI002E135D3B|nr:alpha/beta fold hydrolase [Nocardia sp. NBC_01329]
MTHTEHARQLPEYAAPEAFDEHDLILGSEPVTVPGTLSMPRADGPRPGVVLLSGSGPTDRDGTLGDNKPLRDIAWGLADRGIAVLRFDKITYARPEHIDAKFTAADEYVPHAAAAVGALRAHPAVDPERVFVLGHSLGGRMAPRVAATEPSVAGLILMAASAQPLHWTAVRQIRYLTELGGGASLPTVETITRQARLVDSADLSPSTPREELPLAAPAAYWLDLRDYDPVATAAAVGKPMLILQGGRDYQVTVDDDLARWRAGLEGRAGVTIRVYDADNHLFFPGTGPSTPAEYVPPQHVDPQVVTDIATWLTTT